MQRNKASILHVTEHVTGEILLVLKCIGHIECYELSKHHNQ